MRLYGELATVCLDGAARDRETEAGAAGRRIGHLHKRLEDSIEIIVWDAAAGVTHRDDRFELVEVFARRERGGIAPSAAIALGVADKAIDPAMIFISGALTTLDWDRSPISCDDLMNS